MDNLMCDCAACAEAHDKISATVEGTSSKVDKLNSKVDKLDRLLEVHQAEVHGELVDARTIRQWDKATADKVDRLADAVMGPQARDFDGELHRVREEGLVEKVDRNTRILESIDHQVNNGLKFKLRTSDKVLVAMIGAAVALIQVFWG